MAKKKKVKEVKNENKDNKYEGLNDAQKAHLERMEEAEK